MAQRWRSRARRDPDLDEDGGPPAARPSRRRSEEEDEEAGNEDLSLEILARAAQRGRRRASAGFADVLELSSGDDEEDVDEDAVVELGDAEESRRKQRKKLRRKLKKKQRKEAAGTPAVVVEEEKEVHGTQEEPIGSAESVLTENGVDVPAPDNVVLRKLLRVPRYFDPGETLVATCFNCGEEGHVAANCQMEKRKKPCFVCGLFGHNAKQCTQGQDCFICKKGGHIAKDCPDKNQRNNQQSSLCLRCGETGHDMFGCVSDYPREDIKEIRCYVCKQKGHLCCADFSDNCPKEITCYNCAQSGHSGLGCAKQRKETSDVVTPTVCFKCGEEGHFARGCTKSSKSDRSRFEGSERKWKKDKGKKDFSARSAPYDGRKTSKRKSPHFEERFSKARGGWTGDNLDDLSSSKKHKSKGWASPSTPKKPYTNHQFHGGGYSTPQPSRRHSHGFSSPSSNYHSSGARKHGYSPKRFNTHVRFGRS